MSEHIEAAEAGMQKALDALAREFVNLRTGRPSPAQLDNITVDYYGSPTPISQVAAVKVPEAHLMTIEPWDKALAPAISKAILASSLGVTPNDNGQGCIRLPFPAPTEERRREIVKECKSAAENARVGVRGARRDAKSKLEKAQKGGEMTEDELRRAEDELQKLTDKFVAQVDAALAKKEAEVMEI